MTNTINIKNESKNIDIKLSIENVPLIMEMLRQSQLSKGFKKVKLTFK